MTVTKRDLIAAGFNELSDDAVIFIDNGLTCYDCRRVTVVRNPEEQTQRDEISTTLSDEVLPVGSIVLLSSES